jgi:hypothetical protein
MAIDYTRHGWWDDGGHEACARGLPAFGDFPLVLEAEPAKPILLYKAWRDVLGKDPDYPAQQIGDCVSFGHGHANDLLQCVEIRLGEPSGFRETDTEFIYGTSREVGGMLGRGDGSYGSAAVKAMMTIGVVSREMLASDGAYSGSRARSWGRTGVPAAVKQLAAPFKLGTAAGIRTRAEAISALWNGHPITICSNVGFNTPRDANGKCKAWGVWGHCMFICGFDPATNCYLVCQSWGPGQPSGPLHLDQPTFSFWADASVVERRIFGAGDSWALMRSPEFAKRSMPGSFHRFD